MTAHQIKIFVLASAGILGIIAIGVVIYIYGRNQKVEKGGSIILFSGIILLGLSVWQSFEFSTGQLTLKATSTLELVKKAQSLSKIDIETDKNVTGNCEEERKRLITAIEMERQKRKQVEELLNKIEKSLQVMVQYQWDKGMEQIRNLR